jgi:hypothetical protein
MNQGLVMRQVALPPHQQAAKFIVPRMRPFNHPAPRGRFLLRRDLWGRLPAMFRVQKVLPLLPTLNDIRIILRSSPEK